MLGEFKCWECSFETDDEDEIIYCDCGFTMCLKHTHTIEYQGFDESLCSKCFKEKPQSKIFKGYKVI